MAEQRRKLEALFSNAPANGPTVATGGFGASARTFASARRVGGRRPSERAMQLDMLRQKMSEAITTGDPEAFRRAVDPFLAAHELPDEVEFLRRMLHHPDNQVLCNVMGHISGLLLQRRMQATALLQSTLHDVSKRTDLNAATQSCLDGLQKQMAALQRP